MKGDKAMKKRMISVMTVVALIFGTAMLPKANAQMFILSEEEEIGTSRTTITNTDFPIVPTQNVTYDQLAPLGEGILLLTALGGCYLLGKRRKEE
jgi:hypothetical protein